MCRHDSAPSGGPAGTLVTGEDTDQFPGGGGASDVDDPEAVRFTRFRDQAGAWCDVAQCDFSGVRRPNKDIKVAVVDCLLIKKKRLSAGVCKIDPRTPPHHYISVKRP